MNWKAIKDNWFAIVFVMGLLSAGGAAYTEWRIKEAVKGEFGGMKLVSPEKVDAMAEDIKDNKEYIRKTEDKVERIVNILLED